MDTKRIIQITYNWFSYVQGEHFYDYTVSQPAFNDSFQRFPHQGKIVKEIAIKKGLDGLKVEVSFEDGSSIIQGNINSISYGSIKEGE